MTSHMPGITTGTPLPATVAGVARAHAQARPDAPAYAFIGERDARESWTYRRLDIRARAVAAVLQRDGQQGRPVLLLHPPGLEYVAAFLGCLYAGAIAVPAYPPDTRRGGQSLARLAAITRDCRAASALTTRRVLDLVETAGGQLAEHGLDRLRWLASDEIDDAESSAWSDGGSGGALAMLQYTSGSTATPKGVMVSNDNLLHNLRAIHARLGHDPSSALVSWLPPYHDMGLIGGILTPLYGGIPAYLMAPETFVRRPLTWLETLSSTGASTSVAPNFGFEHCLRRITEEQRDQLDLRRWRLALNGAEPVRADTLDRFAAFFAPCGFDRRALLPCYGLAEATLMVTGVAADRAPVVTAFAADALGTGEARVAGATPAPSRGTRVVGCGQPVDGLEVEIADPDTGRRLGVGRVGEVWVTGPSVARGYWRRPQESARLFRARLDGDGCYLRTGDLGFLHDGQLHLAGRVKDLVIVQGRNYYPHDIELSAEQARTAIRAGCGAAFGVEVDGAEQLVLAYEIDGRAGQEPAVVLAELRAAVAREHDLAPHAIVLLKPSTIPKTTSGKIRRQACRQDFLQLRLAVVAASVLRDDGGVMGEAPRPGRARVAEVARDALTRALGERDEAIGEFAAAGLDYPRLVSAVREIEHALGVRISLGDLLARPSLEHLIELVTDDGASAPAPAGPAGQPAARQRAAAGPRPRAEIQGWLVGQVAARLGLTPAAIDVAAPFRDIGLDSRQGVAVVEELGRWLGTDLAPSIVFDHPTISAVAASLAGPGMTAAASAEGEPDAARSAAPAPPASAPRPEEPIAIVGLGCRLPGAPDAASYWRLLRDGRDALGGVPPDRWDGASVTAPDAGAFLDDVSGFDASFFGISAREAGRIDPQQRLLLEVAWQTLEDAGIAANRLAGSDAGVYVGISSTDYAGLSMRDRDDIDVHAAAGNAHALAANRLSYFFDLRGPSLAVDTACSSALVAVHMACESLRRGECRLALAGGVNLLLTPDLSVAFSRAGMLAADGRCRVFDEHASGYVRGEGAGLVCLKPLSAATADGDRVYAVIRGSSVGHNGRGNGITAPKGSAQRAVIEQALRRARVRPDQVGFVEAHGTGTALGDPIELEALAAVYGHGRRGSRCLVGSAKANIGHLEAAAGVAGLIKAALVTYHSEVPPQPHLRTLNHRLSWHDSGLEAPLELRSLPAGPVRAGVSSFGFGGANAHVVLESPPAPERPGPASAPASGRAAHVLCLSAHTPTALAELARRYRAHLAAHPEIGIADLCQAANTGRAALAHRAAIVCRSRGDLDEALQSLARREAQPDVVTGCPSGRAAPTVAFLFSGQGTQYPGMARALYETHAEFAATIDRADQVLRSELGQSLPALLIDESAGERLRRTRYCQPALIAFEVALAKLWQALGIRPAAVLGHSIGGYAAAHVAGVMSLEDTLMLAAARGRHMDEQPGEGAMISCVGDPGVIRLVAARHPSLSVAAVNTPEHLVLSGERAEIDAAGQELSGRGVTIRRLTVSHAFHSRLMAGAAEPLRAAAATIPFTAPSIPWISDLSAELVQRVDADYWVRHMLATVRFADAFAAARDLGCDAFIEIGPHPTLLGLGRAATLEAQSPALWLPSLRRGTDPWKSLLKSAGQLYCSGAALAWDALGSGNTRAQVSIPGAVFEKQRHWFPQQKSGGIADAAAGDGADSRQDPAPPFADGAEAVPAAPAGGGTRQQVLWHVAQVSGFDVGQIAPHARLGMDLGFDSLMLTELHRRIVRAFPDRDTELRGSLPDDPTVDQLIAVVEGGAAATAARPALVLQAPVPAPSRRQAADAARFEDWAEYRELQQRVQQAEASGINPYGRTHDGFNSGVTTVSGRSVVNFSAFNYLALSNHPRVRAAAKAAIDRYGTSSSATPLLCGETPVHRELDAQIASFLGTDSAIVFAGGHATNVATVGHLFGPDDLILHDEWIHDSSVRGTILSGARRRSFRHNDWQSLDEQLSQLRSQYRHALVVIEGAYSQDGDIPDLPQFIQVKKRHDAMLMIDEAHSIGVLGRTGRGIGEHFGVDRGDVDLWMGTLSKALGSLGGYIAARQPVIDYLKFSTPLYIFSTGSAPANAAAALEALRVIQDEPGRVARLRQLAEHFRAGARERGLDIGVSRASAVIPVILGDWERAMRISNQMLRLGVNVMPIGYPAVDRDKCRLRFFVNVDHTETDLDHSLDILEQAMNASNGDTAATPSQQPGQRPRPQTLPVPGGTDAPDVLVAGASGFIGGHLTRRLAEAGHRVRVLVRAGSDRSGFADTPAEIVVGELHDLDSLRRAAAGVRHVYNCTGMSADWGPWEGFKRVNVDGSMNLLRAARHAGTVERFLHVSTTDVYGYPVEPCDEDTAPRDIGLPYNRSKLLGERAVREAAETAGVPLTVVRPVSVYGPRSKDFVIEIASLLRKRQMVYISRGDVPAGLIYISNLADGMIAACESDATAGKVYNLRDADMTTWREYVEALAHGLGVKPPAVNLPGPLAMGVARASEAVYGRLHVKSRPVLTRHAVRLFDRDQSYPIDRARDDFGFKSAVSFEEGMRLTLDWLESPEGRRLTRGQRAAG